MPPPKAHNHLLKNLDNIKTEKGCWGLARLALDLLQVPNYLQNIYRKILDQFLCSQYHLYIEDKVKDYLRLVDLYFVDKNIDHQLKYHWGLDGRARRPLARRVLLDKYY